MKRAKPELRIVSIERTLSNGLNECRVEAVLFNGNQHSFDNLVTWINKPLTPKRWWQR